MSTPPTPHPRQAFHDWVARHRIGPSMNQRYFAQAKQFVLDSDVLYNGFDGTVRDGWVPILDRLATDLKALGWTGAVDQIKEKFGTLRFYAIPDGVPEDQHAAFWARIQLAEAESAHTCDTCGAPGMLRTDRSMYVTLCDAHQDERKRP